VAILINKLLPDMLTREFRKYSLNKEIPKKYEKEILNALSRYPELRKVHIKFVLVETGPVPYSTKPVLASCLLPKRKREYIVSILEKATYPESEALFEKLTERMRIGVIGHELYHVIQYHFGRFSLLRTVTSFLIRAFRKKLERAADRGAIQHGFGKQLLEHARYIRSIPGYLQKRPSIQTDYLKPSEIEYLLS
jgi:hypothetical protein